MPRLPTLAMSRELLAWLRADPQWQHLDWRLRAALAWKACWGSINARLSESRIKDSSLLQDPILILGPWRSGTTVMHDLLTAATGLPTPLTWQCMNACAFQLVGGDKAQTVTARPMDGLAIGARTPQEDEFALLTLGIPTAYQAFLMPHRLPELHQTLDQDYWLANAEWLTTWEAFLQGVLANEQRPERQLILKSPNHTFRLKAILQRFPAAKLIWMTRPATQVFLSNRKMWRAMFMLHGLSGARIAATELDDFLVRAMDRSAEMLSWCASTLPPSQWLAVAQVSLQTEPTIILTRLCNQLDLPRATGAAPLKEALARVGKGRVEHYELEALPPQVVAACQRFDETQAIAMRVSRADMK